MKHFAYKHRRYKVDDDGKIYQWRALDNTFQMAWRPMRDLELEAEIRSALEKKENDNGN